MICPGCATSVPGGAQFCPECGRAAETIAADVPPSLTDLEERIAALEARIPRSSIMSASFWARAWAIFGHVVAASLPIYGLVILLALLGALTSLE